MGPAYLLVLLPLLSWIILLVFGSLLSKRMVAVVGIFGLFFAMSYAFFLFGQSFVFLAERQVLWTIVPAMNWGFSPINCTFYVDHLALVMCIIVTSISFLIALYSSEYMADSKGYRRYFAVMNLFVFFMLVLVLADNLWILFIGWEGVGVSSYLLIGYYFEEKGAELAAMKAFLTTRIGDLFFMFGMFGCALTFHSLDIQTILQTAAKSYPNGSLAITCITLCLFMGAAGKSAQLPLQTWLPDAMWGPTPVSALIHAATMVTAGVYLLARMSGLFALSLETQSIVVAIGSITLILAGLCAILQTDLKRVLAYSTMGQIGYMFLALGINAPKAAVFHLFTHAFFKALLFLAAGVIGHELHHYDLSRMGGLRKQMPLVSWLFFLGCSSIVGLPLISAGFFSKEWIMAMAWAKGGTFGLAYFIGIIGAFITGIYTTRMVILGFFGKAHQEVRDQSGLRMIVPLFLLGVCSLVVGWLEVPAKIMRVSVFSDYLSSSLPTFNAAHEESIWVLLLPSLCVLIGISFAIFRYSNLTVSIARLKRPTSSIGEILRNNLGFDWLYRVTIVRPYVVLSRIMKSDVLDLVVCSLVRVSYRLLRLVKVLHTENLSHYVSFFVIAALTLASLMVF